MNITPVMAHKLIQVCSKHIILRNNNATLEQQSLSNVQSRVIPSYNCVADSEIREH